jgi:Repeat of unknown function (DUF5648)
MRVAAAIVLAAALAFCRPAAAFGLIELYVVEYFNEVTRHYLLLSDFQEMAGVDAGEAGPGWRRTGYMFVEYPAGQSQTPASPVCRFYAPSINSHFFTADPAECEFLRSRDTGWVFEKIDFGANVPVDGACATGLSPVFRLYNGRARYNDTNHRFTPDPAERAKALAEGWIDEGIAFCTYSWWQSSEKSFYISTTTIRPVAECPNEAFPLGSCIGLLHLPPMTWSVRRYLPTFNNMPNPDYPLAADAITGSTDSIELWARDPSGSMQPVAAHSFFEWSGLPGGLGIHLESRDRTSNPYSSIDPSYQFPAAPDAAAVRPWGDGYDHDLVVSFNLLVKTLRRADAASHAYGHPMIEFVDRRSARHFYVTIATYGTLQPKDFVARDVTTGKVIVSTFFRDGPSFGRRLAGQWIGCGDCAPATDFKFAINHAEFAQVLALARGLEPELSTDPADYLVSNFRFKNEAYGDAEIGVSLRLFALETFFAR